MLLFEREKIIVVDGVEILSYGIDYEFMTIFIISCVVAFGIYFLPSLIAFGRNHRDKIIILLIDVFFGWSIVGWFIALGWSFTKKD